MKGKKKIRVWIIVLFCIIVIAPAAFVLITRLEGEKPSILLKLPQNSINKSHELIIIASDNKSGLRKIWIGLLKDNKEFPLLDKKFPAEGLLRSGKIRKETLKISIDLKKLGITDGKSVLRMVAWDYSWRSWWHGNKKYIEKEITIDTKRPEIDILSKTHNLTQGGAGLVIYRISEPCPESGVFIGKDYFPGHSGYFKNDKVLMAFIALDYSRNISPEIYVQATDSAGNSSKAGFPHYIKKKRFKKDLINIPDRFLSLKMPEFEPELEADIPPDSKMSMLDKFLWVNRKLRKANFDVVINLGEKTDPVLYWSGKFLRLPKSANRAGFADQRTYKYKGRVIDNQIHLGVDLASVAHSPVPAANKGKVVFAEPLGIYGKTVVIDHGFGLYSMYSHLSSLGVQKEQIVAKGEIIGNTGRTGLAGGDHLHFGMFIHKTFVNPVEWWDATWIKNNITNKINNVQSLLNQE